MTKTTRLQAVRWGLAALLLLATSQAGADARTDARRYFLSGMDLIANGDYGRGIEQLRKAYEAQPHPNVLYNIGRAYFEAGELEQAIEYFQKYLETGPADRDEVMAVVARLHARLERQRAVRLAAETPREVEAAKSVAPAGEPPKETVDRSARRKVTPQPALPALPELGARREGETYEETVITASRGAQTPVDAPNSTTIITQQDIRLSGITRTEELLRRVAGIDYMAITGGDTNITMRGFNSRLANKLLVLVDGRSVFLDATGGSFYRALPYDVTQIERIEVVRGPSSALYGADAFGGVINIIMKEPGVGGNGVKLGAGDQRALYGAAWTSGRSDDVAYRMFAGYSQYPRWSRQVAPDRVDLDEIRQQDLGSMNKSFELRTSRRLGRNEIIELGGAYANSTINMFGIGPFYELSADDIHNGELTLHLNTKYLRGRAFYHHTNVRFMRLNSGYEGQRVYPGELLSRMADGEIEFVGDFRAGAVRSTLQAGGGYRMKQVDWYIIDKEHVEHHLALFLQDTLVVGPHWRVVVSGRADYVPYFQRILGSPRASVIFKPSLRQAIRGSYATSFRSPTMLEAYIDIPLHTPATGLQLASEGQHPEDPDFKLDPERIQAIEIGYLNQESVYFDWELTGYYNRVDNLIFVRPVFRGNLSNLAQGTLDLDPRMASYTAGFAGWENHCAIYHVVGGEAGVRVYPTDGLDVFANYSHNRTNVSLPAGCSIPRDERTSAHKANVGVQVRTAFGISGEVILHYVSPQVWAERIGLDYATFGIPAYTLLNARIGYQFLEKRAAEISARVFNALDDRHQEHPLGQFVGRQFMGFASYQF